MLPSHATPEMSARLRELGISAVSLGLQSFNPALLRHLGRPHTVADNQRALASTVDQFACVDADLIFDVAFADEALFLRDVQTCCAAGGDQISTYPLMRFGYTPFGKARHAPQREHIALRRAEELAARYGYVRESVWTFVRVGGPRYSSITREFYLGLGAGAASYSGRFFLVNHFALAPYAARIANGELPLARILDLPAWLSALYYLFWQTYTGTVDQARLAALFPDAGIARALVELGAQLGLLTRQGQLARLSPAGYNHYHNLERLVTYQLIEPLWRSMTEEHQGAGQGASAQPGLQDRRNPVLDPILFE